MTNLLEVRGATVDYGGVPALTDMNITVRASTGVGIVGANGAGKTTLLKVIMGLVRVRSGSVAFRGSRIDSHSPRQRVRLGIAYVPEGRGVLSSLTVDDNLSLAASVVPAGQRVARNKVYDMLPTLAKLRNRKAGALSGGELQLLALARAIVVGPALILLDEPAMGLSPASKDLVLACVTTLRGMGTGVLVAEQDIFLVRTSTEQCVILSLGRSVKDGATQECLGTMALKDAYLGPANRKHAL